MEITKKNFFDELDNITQNIKSSCFIGFDAEFTAILSHDSFKHRLFDTNEERYDRLKTQVSKMIMTQVGLTMFQYQRDLDSYVAIGYTFHLCPQVFGNVDQSFIFQASTLQFLCQHQFDFNKFIYEGIPYLSKSEEASVRQLIKDKSLIKNMTRSLNMNDEKLLQNYCSKVSKWLMLNEEGTMYLEVESPVMRYLVHNEVRLRFPKVLTTDSLGNSKKVLIYRDKYVEGANAAPNAILEDDLMSYLLGFSKVINLLEQYKKPIVGHNLFLDMLLLHNQFVGPLPNKYSTFKKKIHETFPKIYDTKYISHEMNRKLSFDEVWRSNNLKDLYEFFSEGKCRKLQNGVNPIRLKMPFNVRQTYHEAGWDSYCSGYCFIRLGHWSACENGGSYRPVGPTEILSALGQYCNKVNVIRAAVPYMSFVEDDPPSHRPKLIHVKSLREPVINVEKVASLLAGYGSVDIKPIGSKTALVATASQHAADKILKGLKQSKDYRVSVYRKFAHSALHRMALWSGALITGSLVLYYVQKKVKVMT